jgi:hypothetical protein
MIDDVDRRPASMGFDSDSPEVTTAAEILAAYEAVVGLGDSPDLLADAARMRKAYQERTGAFGPEDPWFETRARAFWDDAVATQGFARSVPSLDAKAHAARACFTRSHRGFFVVEDVDDRGAHLVDLWSGAELLVVHLDETQALTLEHAEGAMDARVSSGPSGPALFVLPGAYHHPADALEPATRVLMEARERGMSTEQALDALMRMDLVLRSSSRVKAAFAYRVESLPPARTA